MSQIADELILSASWTKAGTVLVIVGGGSNWDPTPQFAWRAGSGPWNLLGTADLAGSSINAWTLTGVGSAATEIRFTEDEGALREYVIPLEGTPPQPVTPPDPDPGPDPAPDPEPEPDPEPTGEPGTFEDRNISPDTEDTPPSARNPFDGPGNYPSVVFLHQQRLGFAASDRQPLTVWLSQAGNFESMAASVPPADDDAIEATLAAAQANRILWCQSDRNVLALGTAGGEWTLSGGDGGSGGGALTPSSLSFQPQTFYGSEAYLPPLRAGQALLFPQRGGRAVREYGYSFSADRYESGDLSLLARHLLRESPVVSWAWQAEPCAVVWCVREDGGLVGLTYMREHDVVGWHRHVTPGGRLESVIALPGERGATLVWFVVWRNGTRRVERLAAFFEGGDPATACHADGWERAAFTGICVPCLPETTLENGSTLMRVRKLNAVKCRVLRSRPFQARIGDGPLAQVPARGAGYVERADWAAPLGGGWRDGDALELRFPGTAPVTLLALLTTVELADMAGGQG